jgi:hypothetical protein
MMLNSNYSDMNNPKRRLWFGSRRGERPLAPTVRFVTNGISGNKTNIELMFVLFVMKDGA